MNIGSKPDATAGSQVDDGRAASDRADAGSPPSNCGEPTGHQPHPGCFFCAAQSCSYIRLGSLGDRTGCRLDRRLGGSTPGSLASTSRGRRETARPVVFFKSAPLLAHPDWSYGRQSMPEAQFGPRNLLEAPRSPAVRGPRYSPRCWHCNAAMGVRGPDGDRRRGVRGGVGATILWWHLVCTESPGSSPELGRLGGEVVDVAGGIGMGKADFGEDFFAF